MITPDPIRSPQNPRFRALADLIGQPRVRRREGLVWLEGDRLIHALLQTIRQGRYQGVQWQPVCLVMRADRAEATLMSDDIRQLAGLCEEDLLILDAQRFQQVSPLEYSPGLGLVARQVRSDPPEFAAEGDLIVLDRLQDPGNVGTLLRTAAAAGLQRAWLLEGTAEAYSPKALRAGMGAQLGLRIEEGLSAADLARRLVEGGIRPVLTLAPGDGIQSLYSPSLAETVWSQESPLAWCMGQEGSGLSPAILALPHAVRVTIPQAEGPFVESLNVAAAAAVCLFERRRFQSDPPGAGAP